MVLIHSLDPTAVGHISQTDCMSDTIVGGWNPFKNLIAHYLLDDVRDNDDVVDESSNAFHGTMIGGNTEDIDITSLIKDVAGNAIGSAHDFNGSSHAHNINLPVLSGNLPTSTIGTWAFILDPDSVATDSSMFLSFGDADQDTYITIGQAATNGKIMAECKLAGTVQWSFASANVVIANGTKTWVVLVQDGTEPFLLIGDVANGMKKVPITFSTDTDKTAWFNDLTNLDTGRIAALNQFNNGDTNFYNGTLDGLRIYDTDWSLLDAIGWFNQGNGTQAEAGTVPLTAAEAANFINPTETQSASFTPTLGSTTFCDTNAASGDIVVTNPTPAEANDQFVIHLKTDHATRKLTVNGKTLIIAGEWVRVVYDGAAWNNFAHLIPCRARVTRDVAQSIDNNTTTLISFDAEEHDNCSMAATGTAPITIRRAGEYNFQSGWVAENVDDGERGFARILLDDTPYRENSFYSPGANKRLGILTMQTITMAAADTGGLQVYHNEGAAMNTLTGVYKPFLDVTEIV